MVYLIRLGRALRFPIGNFQTLDSRPELSIVDTGRRRRPSEELNDLNLEAIVEEHKRWLLDVSTGRRADLSRRDLTGVDLRGKDLRDADLHNADLDRADLQECDLRGANLSDASLVSANLHGARLSNADLSHADLRNTNLTNVELENAELWRCNFRGCVITPKRLHEILNCRDPEA